MNLSISIRRTANDRGAHWLVLATLDGDCPASPRHHFAIVTDTEREALGVAGDLLQIEQLDEIASIKSRAGIQRFGSDYR
jgi:hypothetical protein